MIKKKQKILNTNHSLSKYFRFKIDYNFKYELKYK